MIYRFDLTARAEIDDRVSALDLGADDYIVKPFDFRELAALQEHYSEETEGAPQPTYIFSSLTYDSASAGSGPS